MTKIIHRMQIDRALIKVAPLILLTTSCGGSGRQGRYSKKGYEIAGLPNKDEIGESLMIAIPLILIGFLICYFVWWNKKTDPKDSGAEAATGAKGVIGCLGFLVLLTGLFFLLPILAWVELIGTVAIRLGIVFIVIAVIIYSLYTWSKKSEN
jgi:hypothetical protein